VTKKNNRNFKINLWNDNQKSAWEKSKKADVIVLEGPAGVGKTFLAVAIGIREIIEGRAKRLVFVRPAIEAGEDLGYLPGNVKEKVDPYMRPLYDQFDKLTDTGDDDDLAKIPVEVTAVAMLQGRTFVDSICILDEAQNCNFKQHLLYFTRMGNNSKMIFSGDSTQPYIPDSGLMKFCDRLRDFKEFSETRFDESDIVRHKTVAKFLPALICD